MKFLMLSCGKATQLMEQRLSIGRLPFYQEWQLHFHVKMCDACRRFAMQSAAVEQAFRKKLENDEDPDFGATNEMPFLDAEMKEKILTRLRSSG